MSMCLLAMRKLEVSPKNAFCFSSVMASKKPWRTLPVVDGVWLVRVQDTGIAPVTGATHVRVMENPDTAGTKTWSLRVGYELAENHRGAHDMAGVQLSAIL